MKKWFSKALYGAILGLLSAVIVWVLTEYIAEELMYSYEAQTYDWRMEKKIADAPDVIDDIIIVDIDARSIQKLGKFSQWPRQYHTKVVEFLSDAGAMAIGLDILYDRDTWRPEQDVEFVNAVQQAGNVYNAVYFAMADSDNFRYVMPEEPEAFKAREHYYRLPNVKMRHFREEERFESDFYELLNASRGCGHVNFKPDVDGVVRSIHLFSRFNNHLYPSLGFRIFMDLIQVDSVSFDVGKHLNLLRDEQIISQIPVDKNGDMLINYAGRFKTFRYISFYDVLKAKERNLDPRYFKNKIVLVGTSLPGLFDLRSVPFMQAFPGVEIHANILNTLLKQDFIKALKNHETFIMLAGIGIIFGIIISLISPLLSVILTFVFAAGHIMLSLFLFLQNNLWIATVSPVLTIVITLTLVYLYRYVTEERNKRFIRSTFSHFVTKSVVDELLANPDKIKLGGEKKNCTVLFSDVAGFTSISEKLQPEDLVTLLNEYLTEMTNTVFEFDGMLDKYEGDAIMAVFGAPVERGNHAFNACAAALGMQKRLVKLRQRWAKEGKPELAARIGINTGPMVVGNMGSENRFDYTAMGDAVNLGARLEPANKEYGTLIMIGNQTYEQAKESIVVRPLDLLRVKGREEPERVYELIALSNETLSDVQEKIVELFTRGFENYLKKNWDWAENYFRQILDLKADDQPSKVYLQRCREFKENPPAENWDGVYSMTYK
ncbi:MAG: CHASE2 domain-containing protein [Caldithrix sp.]|nr:CHASE2 domain-containing protein [Caldithrix sp.]